MDIENMKHLIVTHRYNTMTQVYMILGANGSEKGAPIGFYTSLIKAQYIFNAISDIGSAFTGNLTAFLVVYELFEDGTLLETNELGRK